MCGQTMRPSAIAPSARVPQARVKSVRAADHQREVAQHRRRPSRAARGELRRARRRPALVERHHPRAARQRRRDQRRFGGRAAALAVLDLDHRRRPKAERPRRPVEPRQVVRHQRRFRAGAHPADRDDRDAQASDRVGRPRPRRRVPGPHLFELVEVAHLGPEDVHDRRRRRRSAPSRRVPCPRRARSGRGRPSVGRRAFRRSRRPAGKTARWRSPCDRPFRTCLRAGW